MTRSVLNAIRREYLKSDARLNNQIKAWRAGKNVVLTVKNLIKRILKSV